MGIVAFSMVAGDVESFSDALIVVLSLGLAVLAVALLLRFLGRSRPGLPLFWPVVAALGVRVLLMAFLALIGAQEDRGGDEEFFLFQASAIVRTPLGSELWLDAITDQLHVAVFAIQVEVLDSPELALRFVQDGIAVCGLILLATAVFDLAGRRAALVAGWLIMLEPATVFFSGILHKEANLMLATGLVAIGAVRIWRTGELRGLLPMLVGCAIAVGTRNYAGLFLIAASGLIIFHAGIRNRSKGYAQSLAYLSLVAALVAVTVPFLLSPKTFENLDRLQEYQAANVANPRSNLNLDQVDYSSPQEVARNLPRRVRDMLTRPYPWELGNLEQQLGLLGTIAVLATLGALARELYLSRGRILARAGPLVYIGLMLAIAYSLSAGNAGTLYRYRIHVLMVGICLTVSLWQLRLHAAPSPVRYPRAAVPASSS